MSVKGKFLEKFSIPYGVIWDNDNCCFAAQFSGVESQLLIYNSMWEAFQEGHKIAMKEHKHVGYTNGANIKLLHQTDYGAMYSTTDQNCFIPLYMLEDHVHRIETTGGDELTAKKMKS